MRDAELLLCVKSQRKKASEGTGRAGLVSYRAGSASLYLRWCEVALGAVACTAARSLGPVLAGYTRRGTAAGRKESAQNSPLDWAYMEDTNCISQEQTLTCDAWALLVFKTKSFFLRCDSEATMVLEAPNFLTQAYNVTEDSAQKNINASGKRDFAVTPEKQYKEPHGSDKAVLNSTDAPPVVKRTQRYEVCR